MFRTELFELLFYFGIGIVQDFIFTMNLKYVVKKKITLAVACSFVAVFTNMAVLYSILKELDCNRNMLAIFFYSLGIALGTYLAMKIPSGSKKKTKRRFHRKSLVAQSGNHRSLGSSDGPFFIIKMVKCGEMWSA